MKQNTNGTAKIFATIMDIENVHLTKDVGLIPYGMSKYYGYNSYCVTYNNPPYSNLKNVPGLKIWAVKKITGDFDFDAFLFLMKHAKDIDVLNVYHQRRWSAIYIRLYKFLNPRGLVYWKLDGGGFDKETNKAKQKVYSAAIGKCSIVSTETKENVKKQSDFTRKKFVYIPNPYDPNLEKPFCPFCERENTILTVGRLGTKQKATDVLMEAFRKACLNIPQSWKLRLVGPIEKVETDFQKYIDEWFAQYPEMKGRVEFAGGISDREELSAEYQKAKIFAFPSRYEGFSLAMIEAGAAGNLIIGTDIPSIRAFTCDFEFSESFPVDDIAALVAKIEQCCNMSNHQLEEKARKLYDYVVADYSLRSCCAKIQESLKI